MPHYMSQDNPRFNAALRDEYSMYAQLHDEEINGRHSCMFVIIPTYIWLFFIHDSSMINHARRHAAASDLVCEFRNGGSSSMSRYYTVSAKLLEQWPRPGTCTITICPRVTYSTVIRRDTTVDRRMGRAVDAIKYSIQY